MRDSVIETDTRKRKRRVWGIVVAAVMLGAMVLSGCSSSKDEPESSASASAATATATVTATVTATATPTAATPVAPKEIVELKAFFPGDIPAGFEAVQTAVNEKLKKDNVGASLKIQFVPWADYANLTNVKVAAGEEFDMFLDAPWQHINQMIASGGIIALDDLVAQQPELLKAIPQSMWDANKFGGKIMGVPLGTTQPSGLQGFLVRQDLREKYGLPPIKTLDELIKFLQTVKEKDPTIIPYINDGRFGPNEISLFSNASFTAQDDGYAAANSINNFYYVGADKKIHPITDSPQFVEGAKTTSRLYKEGLFEKNMAQEENAITIFNQGKAAAIFYTPDGVLGLRNVDALKNPGVKLEVVIPINDDHKLLSNFKQWNFLVVPKSSKHADLVMAVMNWLSIKENHDLLEYGIPEKDWSPVGEDSLRVLSKYAFPGYVMTWRPGLVRTFETMLPDDKMWFEKVRDASNFIASQTVGFTPDFTAVKSEAAKMDTLSASIIIPMGNGVLDSAKGLQMLKDGMEKAGSEKVIAELQKQYDAYLAAK